MAFWLVTGGCGFIGSHLVEALLKRGDRVRILDDLSTGRRHPEIERAELLIGDVADPDAVKRAMDGVDGCFHLAAIASVQRCSEDWLGAHRTNLTGTITIFDAARQRSPAVPVVYASSAAIYGDNPHVPLAETAEAKPLSAYGADKLGSEFHARVAWNVHRVPNVGLRFFNVYGPRQDPRSPYSGVISVFIDRIIANRAVEIHGDGEQTRDFIYVQDVIAHLVAAMTAPPQAAQVFNLCTGRSTSVNQLGATIANISGRAWRAERRPARVGDIRTSIGDPSAVTKAYRLPGPIDIAEGLRRTMAAL